jgi:hypothetical protein
MALGLTQPLNCQETLEEVHKTLLDYGNKFTARRIWSGDFIAEIVSTSKSGIFFFVRKIREMIKPLD